MPQDNIPILDVLDRLGIKYRKEGTTAHLYEGSKVTDGWKANITGNYVNDFSSKRATGSPFAFVKHYLNLSANQTYTRFRSNFGIDTNTYKQNKIPLVQRKVYTRDRLK